MIYDSIVCFCFSVTEEEIRKAIREHGLTSVEEIAARTYACLGCRTCRPEIESILADEKLHDAGGEKPPASSGT